MSRESAVTLAVCQEILTKIAVTKKPVSEIAVPPAVYNMVLLEREETPPRIADVLVTRLTRPQ